MMLTHHGGDGGNKARSPERARKKPLKPFAQEKPERFGEPVVTCSCAFLLSHARLRVRKSIRLFLRPLLLRDMIWHSSGESRCGDAEACLFFSLAPFLRGEGWGEGLCARTVRIVSPPHPNCTGRCYASPGAIRPLPASGAR